MTQTLERQGVFDPLENYAGNNYPPHEVQGEFFDYALQEGREIEGYSRSVKGPHFDDFAGVMKSLETSIEAIYPGLTPEFIMPPTYMSGDVCARYNALPLEVQLELEQLARKKLEALTSVGEAMKGAIGMQTLAPDLLAIPPFCGQHEDHMGVGAMKGCTNACFRMIFGGITGWVPSEAAVSKRVETRYGTPLVDDSVYMNLFKTEIFREICDKSVSTVEIIGADFAYIEKVVSALKVKRPESETYCMVNLASQAVSKSVWHSCVVLGVDEGNVICHDPSNYGGGSYQVTPINEFTDRWAVAYNRALLVVAS